MLKGRFAAGAFVLLAWAVASADYDSHPTLRPENRCATIPVAANDAGGLRSPSCQRLFWDLPAATRLGFVAAAAPIAEPRAPRFPNGLTDRPPPMYILDRNHDGVADDGQGYEAPGQGRARLCADPDEVPWWKPMVDAKGQPQIGRDPSFGQTGPLFVVACRRGSRERFGPWQAGIRRDLADDVAEGLLRVENSKRLDRDAKVRGLDGKRDGRREWLTAIEFYDHFAIHHAVCWIPVNATCDNPDDPWTASDMTRCYEGYQQLADGPDGPHGKGGCYGGDQDTRCVKPKQTGETGWFLTTVPGRLYTELPQGQAMPTLENQLWRCLQHVVFQYPPDDVGKDMAFHEVRSESYGLDRPADYRLQKGGLANIAPEPQHGAKPGETIGGAVGEMIVQYFTEPYTSTNVKPMNAVAPVRNGDLNDFLLRRGKPSPRATPPGGNGERR